MRENTERPATIKEGRNVLVGRNKNKILDYAEQILQGKWEKSKIPKPLDGRTAKRIVEILLKYK